MTSLPPFWTMSPNIQVFFFDGTPKEVVERQYFNLIIVQARDEYLRPQKIREEYDDTFTSVLGLRFEISRHHFRQGVIRLKCSSSLLTIYWQSSMVSTVKDYDLSE